MDDVLLHSHGASRVRGQDSSKAHHVEAKSARVDGSAQRLRKAVSTTFRDVNSAILSFKDGLTYQEREQVRSLEERKRRLAGQMKTAESYTLWRAAAQELDTLEGNESWKNDTTSKDCNSALIEERLRALDDARLKGDVKTMMHLVRTALSRDLGGMDSVELYRRSYVGTKKAIERYVESAIQTINAIVAHTANQGSQSRDLLEGMLFSRQSFGRSALLLSGGGTFGMTHIGVLKALFDAQLLPRIISGASAGSIVCAVMCTTTDEDIPTLIREFPYGDLAVFEAQDSNIGPLGHLRRLLTEGSWSDNDNLVRVMRGLLGDMTFQEAYNRTRRILNICVSTASIYELPRLLNYVTAPNLMIWSAVAASCSLPLVYTSSPLLVKDPVTGEHLPWTPTPQHFIDGSVDNDLPMTRLAEMFNVNHFIVSQVNPHVVPFLAKDDVHPSGSYDKPPTGDFNLGYTLSTLARDEALHRLQFMAELGIFPNLMTKVQTMLSQKYSGDITILPEIAVNDLPRLLANPTVEFMLRSCRLGERATWPRLSRIRDRCAIELALDRAVHQLRTRVVFSESQRNLRELSSGMAQMRMDTPVSISQAQDGGPARRRRRSGGSVQTLADGRIVVQPDVTDEETAAEERHELLSRVTPPQRKPRLKRASKSHINVPQHKAVPTIAPSHDFAAVPEFNFSRMPGRAVSTDVGRKQTPAAHTRVWSEVLSRGDITSLDGMETSEQGHSSDADGEQATEESDPDPYEGKARHEAA